MTALLSVHMLCMTLLSILILTVGHNSTPKCVCMLCMILSSILILTVGHDSTPKCACAVYDTVKHSDTYSGS